MSKLYEAINIIHEYNVLESLKRKNFQLNKKLKHFGFKNINEVRFEEHKLLLKLLNIEVIDYVDLSILNDVVDDSIINKKNRLIISYPKNDIGLFIGNHEYNHKYCLDNNIYVVDLKYQGDVIVTTPNDCGMIWVIHDKVKFYRTWRQLIYNWMRENIGEFETDGCRIKYLDNTLAWYFQWNASQDVFYFQMNFNNNLETIQNIGSRKTEKNIIYSKAINGPTKEKFIADVKKWVL